VERRRQRQMCIRDSANIVAQTTGVEDAGPSQSLPPAQKMGVGVAPHSALRMSQGAAHKLQPRYSLNLKFDAAACEAVL
jgi:hypothetical protein